MKRSLAIFFFVCAAVVNASAQCAMCRSTLENNYSNGQPGIAAGINMGILYLLFLPYIAAMVIGFLWYKSSKNGGKDFGKGVA
jgi:hypothetical protein